MPILGVKGGISEGSYRGELDDTPEIFTFENIIGVEPGVTYTSGIATVSGLNYRAKVSIVGAGASFSINGGGYISTVGFVRNGDTVRLAITPQRTFNPVDFNRNTTATLKVGRFLTPWNLRTRPIDGTPDPFSFPTVFNAGIGTEIFSDFVTLAGIETNTFTTASVLSDMGLMVINGAPGVRTANVFSGDELILIRPALVDTQSSYTNPAIISVVIGGFTTSWTVNPIQADTTPNTFSLVDVSSAGIGTVITSNAITVSGINSTAVPPFTVPISIGSTFGASFSYNINGGSYRTTTGSVSNGDAIRARVTTPSIYSTNIVGILTIGGISTSWSLTTRPTPINTIPDAFIFNDIGNNEALNTVLTSNSVTLTGISSGEFGVAFISNGSGLFRVTRNNVVIRDYSGSPTTVQNNDVISLRLTSPVNYGQSASTTFAVSGVDFDSNQGARSDTWTITNFPSPDAPIVKFSVGSDPNAEILNTTINLGASATLSWSVTGQISGAVTSVTINQGIGTVANSGSISVSPTTTTTYTLTATGPGGTVSQNITVVIPPAPVVSSFSASPSPIPRGSSATLSWNVTNTTTSISINQGIGNVAANSSVSVSPTVDTTYAITASGPGGITTSTTTLDVIPPPTITFTASPVNLTTGGSSTLSWSSPDADTVTINQGIGAVAITGNRVVTPASTTTYSLTATNISGVTTANTTVNVFPLPTINSFSLNPTSISAGSNSTLSWNVSGATSISINGGIGAVSSSGSRTVNPSSTTTYTITATNAAGGSRTSSATLTVNQPPTANFTASPSNINTGSSSTLSWTTTNATSVSITNIGSVSTSGTRSVSPTTTTTYTLTATGTGGSVSRSVTITVTCSDNATAINYRYGSGVCGSCASDSCYGRYWLCTDGNYYGNGNQMGGRVGTVNIVHIGACGRLPTRDEIDNEVSIYISLGENNGAYQSNVSSRKPVQSQPRTVCGNSVFDLQGNLYCNG
jgi:hypothetical protein